MQLAPRSLGLMGAICNHLAKVLLLKDATEAQLIQFLGVLWGSKRGGWQALFAAMAGQGQPGAAMGSGGMGAVDVFEQQLPPTNNQRCRRQTPCGCTRLQQLIISCCRNGWRCAGHGAGLQASEWATDEGQRVQR